MKLPILSLFLFLFVFSSCRNESKSKIDDTAQQEAMPTLPIKEYIKKFSIVPLPFYFKGWTESSFDRSKLFELNKNSIDTLFFKIDEESTVYGYGLLADTSNYYSLIYFGQADDIFPILVTYSKSGQELSKTNLLVHGCGNDCGLSYCSYTVHLNKDLNIYIADTLKYEATCDSLGDYLPNSDTTFIYSKKGYVDRTGKVKLGDELVEKRKNNQ